MGIGIIPSLVAGLGAAKAMSPKPPKLPDPLPMPDPLATDDAKRKALLAQMARSGRASTMLTDKQTLGG